jgi:hypothetical protein
VIRNNELGRMYNVTVMAYFNVLSHHVSGRPGENNINFNKQAHIAVTRLVCIWDYPFRMLARLLAILNESLMVFISLSRKSPGYYQTITPTCSLLQILWPHHLTLYKLCRCKNMIK